MIIYYDVLFEEPSQNIGINSCCSKISWSTPPKLDTEHELCHHCAMVFPGDHVLCFSCLSLNRIFLYPWEPRRHWGHILSSHLRERRFSFRLHYLCGVSAQTRTHTHIQIHTCIWSAWVQLIYHVEHIISFLYVSSSNLPVACPF